jgi:type III secretion protein V
MKALAVPFLILCTLCGFLVPLPAVLLDCLIVVNCVLALVLLATVLYVEEPLELSALPGILLVAALFRIGLNISTTRMILVGGSEMSAIVESAGAIALQGSVVVGMTVFLIITLVQFVVISKGAERVAEVSARFVLDALPGRQMSIDADARGGVITVAQAMERRERLQTESRFYAALDGSMKFVKGDAIAGLGITAINLVGGFGIGIGLHGMSPGEAAVTYSLLTVGDGLVSQVPSLLNSIAAGMLITKVCHSGNTLANDLIAQLAGKPPVRIGVGVVFGVLPLFFPLPIVPFLAPGLFLVLTALYPSRGKTMTPVLTGDVPAINRGESGSLKLRGSSDVSVSDPQGVRLAIEQAVVRLRERNGVCIDSVSYETVDTMQGFELYLRGGLIASEQELRVNQPEWSVESEQLAEWLVTQIDGVADELIDDRATRRIILFHAENGFEISQDILPGTISITRVTSLLRALLKARISIAQFDVIMQAISESAQAGADEFTMLRDVRIALKRQITGEISQNGVINCAIIERDLEEQLSNDYLQTGNVQSLRASWFESKGQDVTTLVCGALIRNGVEAFLQAARIDCKVIAYEELLPSVELNTVWVLSEPGANEESQLIIADVANVSDLFDEAA